MPRGAVEGEEVAGVRMRRLHWRERDLLEADDRTTSQSQSKLEDHARRTKGDVAVVDNAISNRVFDGDF